MGGIRKWRRAVILGLAGASFGLGGCSEPQKTVTFPPGTLRVRYEPATTHSTCLVASVAMTANYVLDERRFTETHIRNDLKRTGRDETRIGDLQSYLAESCRDLRLITLAGRLDETAPLGLVYWLEQRGYPVICVINRDPVDPAFNHAVVVIGISRNPEAGSADIIHYLDPSSTEPLHSTDAPIFEVLWSRCSYAMMLLLEPPPDSGGL